MQIKKNDVFEIKIEDFSSNGEGIGKVNGYALFVKDAIIGDYAEVKVTKANKNYGFARLMRVIEPSTARVEPRCSIARQCGGCQIQALAYMDQLKFKENKVRNNLERLGKLNPDKDCFTIHPIIGMDNPYHYRNKAQYPVGLDKNGEIVMGFYAGRTHSIIETEKCYIGSELDGQILVKIKEFMKEFNILPYDEVSHKGLVRHILIRVGFRTGEIMVSVVINGMQLPHSDELVNSLLTIPGMKSISLNVNKEKTNVIMGTHLIQLYGKGYITDYIGNVQYQISPLSFYQVNPVQTEKLYGTALQYAGLTGKETVWDLYCGIGTISLFLAQNALQVYGVEMIPEAIQDAGNNAKINEITNVEFFVGKAEEVLPTYYNEHGGYADVIVVDPPRKGCDETLLDTIAEMGPDRVVYVSCDSATLARDLRYLCDRGYSVKEVQPVDMFGHSVHVETVCCLQRVNL